MQATDWTAYYQNKSKTASVTRKYAQEIIIKQIQKWCVKTPEIFELGGANSCFFDRIYETVNPKQYTVIDNNEYGLSLFREKCRTMQNVSAIHLNLNAPQEILSKEVSSTADLVFSAGLIEHFDKTGTANVISSHFAMAKPGGIVLITFPTPTKKYLFFRRCMERLGVWKFYDERPLLPEEVVSAAEPYGVLQEQILLGKMPLTQFLLVFQKREKA